MKEKLKVTKIPKLLLIDNQNNTKHYFNEFYHYIKFLGAGSFGFVVAASDILNKKVLALKVSNFNFLIYLIIRLSIQNIKALYIH
jgi:serine/threonine protein kinase